MKGRQHPNLQDLAFYRVVIGIHAEVLFYPISCIAFREIRRRAHNLCVVHSVPM